MLEIADEAAVDLEPVERQHAKLRKAGIAHAEIVQRHDHPLIAQAGEGVADQAGIVVKCALGDLDFEPRCREGMRHEHLEHLLSEPRVAQLQRRNVDRDR